MNIPLQTILTGAVVFLGIGTIFLGAYLWRVERKLRLFLQGKDAKSLEDVMALLRREAMDARKSLHTLDEQMKDVERRLRRSVQHAGMVRFNPFQDAGGDQSFCMALLDEHRDGVVISSLYSRSGVRVYGKPLRAGSSQYQLSEEEKQAIQQAIKES